MVLLLSCSLSTVFWLPTASNPASPSLIPVFQYDQGRYEIRRRENRCLLSFPEMTPEFEGNYECKITVGDAVTSCTLKCEGRKKREKKAKKPS